MNSPLVSVIIPNYNHAKFLDERIQSVLNQTYQNFEVIILDDKSTDNSVELSTNIKIIHTYPMLLLTKRIVAQRLNSGTKDLNWLKEKSFG